MKRKPRTLLFLLALLLFIGTAAVKEMRAPVYRELYQVRIVDLQVSLEAVLAELKESGKEFTPSERLRVVQMLHDARIDLKAIDFWLRYLAPISYKSIHSPLPVEWETEVFHKFEVPYRRDGGGLMLAETAIDEGASPSEAAGLIDRALAATYAYLSDSIRPAIYEPDHFLYANRLFLLNLASIYTTGFECPDADRIIPELRHLLRSVDDIYLAYGKTWPERALPEGYLTTYADMRRFVDTSPDPSDEFDHFHFIRDFVNPLYKINQELIRERRPRSLSWNNYSLNNDVNSIFDKSVYRGQPIAGAFASVRDPQVLDEIRETGRLLFFDPILSGNKKRSCASCHHPDKMFSDGAPFSMDISGFGVLPRHTPSLINAVHQHLLHQDGKHISPQSQAIGVITNPIEMGGDTGEILEQIMSCKTYRKSFQSYLQHIPGAREVQIGHIVSALTLFYGSFSFESAPFDDAMNSQIELPDEIVHGFNLFMGKGRCGTCHFVPQFNGVKPPFHGSEFEILGVPDDKTYKELSADSGRYDVWPEPEMLRAFRTPTLRNIDLTGPYMHNGVFTTLKEVLEFYNHGGGVGHGLEVPGQTLPPDSLGLTVEEEQAIISFMESLTEPVDLPEPPGHLPASSIGALKNRKVGGEY